jgi:hypothetical protein
LDALGGLLETGSVVPCPARLRGALLLRTTGVLRRRRRLRRIAFAAAMTACYLAGMGTVQVWQSALRASDGSDAVAVDEDTSRDAAATSRGDDKAPREADAKAPSSKDEPASDPASAVASGGFDSSLDAIPPIQPPHAPSIPRKASRFENLKQLGDRHLYEHNDPASAARCYRMALRHATREERAAIATDAPWLLRALEQDLTYDRSYQRPVEDSDEKRDAKS